MSRLAALLERRTGPLSKPPKDDHVARLRAHVVLCGYGRVGQIVAHSLERRGFTYAIIDGNRRRVEELRKRGIVALYGDAANPVFLEHAHVAQARVVVIAIADPPVVRHIVEQARHLNPRVSIVARTHSDEEWTHLRENGVDEAVLGERELAAEMARYTLHRFGVSGHELQAIVQGLRQAGAQR